MCRLLPVGTLSDAQALLSWETFRAISLTACVYRHTGFGVSTQVWLRFCCVTLGESQKSLRWIAHLTDGSNNNYLVVLSLGFVRWCSWVQFEDYKQLISVGIERVTNAPYSGWDTVRDWVKKYKYTKSYFPYYLPQGRVVNHWGFGKPLHRKVDITKFFFRFTFG